MRGIVTRTAQQERSFAGTQTCTKCGTDYPATREFFSARCDRTKPWTKRLSSWCLGCRRIASKAWYARRVLVNDCNAPGGKECSSP